MLAGITWILYWHCIVTELWLDPCAFAIAFSLKDGLQNLLNTLTVCSKARITLWMTHEHVDTMGFRPRHCTTNAWRMTNNKNFCTVSRPWISRKCSDLSTIVEEHHILMRFLAKDLHSDCKGLFSFHWHTLSTSLAKFLSVVLPPDSNLKITIIYVENRIFPVV